jgi:hypothetical protein
VTVHTRLSITTVDVVRHAQEVVDTTHNRFLVLADMLPLLLCLDAQHVFTQLLVNHNLSVAVKKSVVFKNKNIMW